MYKLILLGLHVLPFLSFGQLQVSGVTKTESGEGIPFASVLLLHPLDSSLIKGQVTNESGQYKLEGIIAGNYIIKVSSIGYLSYSTPIFELNVKNSPLKMGEIKLYENVALLSDVIIKAKKPLYEQKIDRTVINVEDNISSSGGSLLDVLQRSPGVTVDKMNNAISLVGKQGVKIMINGKITRLPMEALVEMMNGINAENVKQIELITTPSSKYEAEGDAGMINIVLKKNEDMGTNGSISAFSGYGNRGKYGGTLNLNSKYDRINVYGDLSIRNNYSTQDFKSTWQLPVGNDILITNSINERLPFNSDKSGTFGLDFNLSDKTIFGVKINLFDHKENLESNGHINRVLEANPYDQMTQDVRGDNNWQNLLGNLNFQHNFSNENNLTANFDKIIYNARNPLNYKITHSNKIDNADNLREIRTGKDTEIQISTFALDYQGVINKSISFEAGIKGTFSDLENNASVDTIRNGVWVQDLDLTNYAEMKEDIYASYASFQIKASEKIDIQLGIRQEQTITKIDTRTEKNVVDRNFNKWFPSIFFNHRINNKNSWVASYSRRITRPTFFQLAPLVLFLDPNNLATGNITLLPAFTNAFRLEYVLNSFIWSFQYSHDENSIGLFQPRIIGNKQVQASENLNFKNNFNLSFSAPFTITDWWNIQLNAAANLFYVQAEFTENTFSINSQSLNLSLFQTYELTNKITLQLSGWYNSGEPFGTGQIKPNGAVNIGFEKKFEQSSLRISINDILQTNVFRVGVEIPNEKINTSFQGKWETTVLSVNYRISLGNQNIQKRKIRKNSSKEELKRLEN